MCVYGDGVKMLMFSNSAKTQNVTTHFVNATPTDYQFQAGGESSQSNRTYTLELSQTRKLETDRHFYAERRNILLREVNSMEVKMGITNRWQPSSPEYIDTLKYMSTRTYHRALDNLQRLVVQRLFELHKLNLAQTGESILYSFMI